MVTNGRQRILSAMAPSGLSWQALYERLTRCGDEVCLVHGQAVRNIVKPCRMGPGKPLQTRLPVSAISYDRHVLSARCP